MHIVWANVHLIAKMKETLKPFGRRRVRQEIQVYPYAIRAVIIHV